MARWTGTTTQRGYGHAHQKLRAAWQPAVDAGHAHCHAVICLMPTRAILPGSPWHLGHNPQRTAWTGPEHRRCNIADARRRQQGRAAAPGMVTVQRMVTSRTW